MSRKRIIPKVPSRGFLVVQVLVFAGVASVILSALAFWGATSFTASRKNYLREQAFHIAEAGVEYYRWHLAHDTDDYMDGTNQPGSYVHPYLDKNGVQIGTFTLTITPPPLGGTTVGIRSVGKVTEDPTITRAVEVTMSIASFARYALLAQGTLSVGTGVNVSGQVHANGGVRFDGTARNLVTSSVDKFKDPTHAPALPDELGVHTNISPQDPYPPVSAIPSRPEVFQAGRQFPPFYNVSAVNFGSLTATLLDLKNKALEDGFHLPKASGSDAGYHIVFKTNGTFDLYSVTKLLPNGICPKVSSQSGWEVASIDEESFVSNNPYPTNGIIFAEDNLWIDGAVNGRLTVAAGSFIDNGQGDPQQKNITINRDLIYDSYDGTDVLGVIAQNNISTGLVSDTDLRIDGALIAKGGRIGRYYFAPPLGNNQKCAPHHTKNSLYLYGMQATYATGGFSYGDNTGYQNRTIVYDPNLYYNPPPSFPLTSSQYSILKWREIQ